MHNSVNALLARSVPLLVAERLVADGYTLQRLRSLNLGELEQLGIPSDAAQGITSGRPPIPKPVLTKLLFANKFVCCVCRNVQMGIVVHHIRPWAESRSHAPDNLAVLCANHHVEAHTTRTIGLSLTQDRIRQCKAEWEAQTRTDDNAAIRYALQPHQGNWYYFNRLRLFELASTLNIHLSSMSQFKSALAQGVIDASGALTHNPEAVNYFCEGSKLLVIYAYVQAMVDRILERLSITNISDLLDGGTLKGLLVPGDIIYVQGAHNFSFHGNAASGVGQIVTGTRTANNVSIEFTFDRWEATSSSSWGGWLRGRQVVGSFCQIKNISREDRRITIQCTVLAINAGAPELAQRNYLNASVSAYMTHLQFDDPTWGDEEEDGASF